MSGEAQPDVPIHRPVSARERLATIYRAPGPYVTTYLATRAQDADPPADLDERWLGLRAELDATGAPDIALKAIDARLTLPIPEDSAAVAVVAAADGTTIVDHGMEPPRADIALYDSLPYAAPLVEWHQRRVAHLVVVADDAGADVVSFRTDHLTTVASYDEPIDALVDTIAGHAGAIAAELILVSAHDDLGEQLTEKLRAVLPVHCRVFDEDLDQGWEDLADITVREVSNLVAKRTVGRLRELRFLTTHDRAVDGSTETMAALADGSARLLLIHDDPRDDRRVWIGPHPQQLSLDQHPDYPATARLVDAAIRSAVLQQIPIHIIPSTGPDGPEDDTAALL